MTGDNFGQRVFALLLLAGLCCCLCAQALAQQPDSSASPDAANANADQTPSLADLARKARKDHTQDVQMSQADAQKLFESVDKIFAFAAEDSGFPQRSSVKRRLIGASDVEQYVREQESKQEYAQRFAAAEMTMKKFGFLPRDFNLREFLVKANGRQLAAFYDPETKTISMLNWIPAEQQAPILAHELTHALQDQNYGLKAFLKEPKAANPTESEDDVPSAHRAVVEGQAQVVFVDYLLAPIGRSLLTTPGLIYQMEEPAVKATADSEFLHNAPMIMREAGTFPYRAGLIFEGELLQKGGKQMAFAGPFARPPRTTHEVLQPKAYLEHEKLPPVHIPDMLPLLDGKYSIFDSGTIGELDVKALIEQYGQRRMADDLASAWMGGRYVTFQKSDADAKNLSTTDLAMLYVSHWRSPQAAERFAHIYAAAVSGRYQGTARQDAGPCAETRCPLSATGFSTEEGPVIVQLWPDNTVLVSESFDQATAAKLLNAAQNPGKEAHASNLSEDELGLRLYEIPGFSIFQDKIRELITEQIVTRINQ
jgi:phosphopantetheinyl transferase (holo-ACP synthase)